MGMDMRVRAYVIVEYDMPDFVWGNLSDEDAMECEAGAMHGNVDILAEEMKREGIEYIKVAPAANTRPITGQLALEFGL